MRQEKLSGLFINCVKAQDSIFESGQMAYQCLLGSDQYSLDYIETDIENRSVSMSYDFYLFNYHMVTMSWLDTELIKSVLPGLKMTIVLEVSPDNPFVYCSPNDFDAYCVLDPTLKSTQKNVFSFPRPLETVDNLAPYVPKDIPIFGSFGFATKGKGFEHLIEAVNKEFERAVVRINIPYASYADATRSYAEQLSETCKSMANSGIEVFVTHDFMSKFELIKWCSENTINCFLYDRNMPGLAATTDQAISSGRPLIISKNDTFRHIEEFIKPYPQQTLREAIENTQKIVEQIQKEWSPQKFREKFEQALNSCQISRQIENAKSAEFINLPVKENLPLTFIQKVRNKAAVKTRLKNFVKGQGLTR